MKKFTLINIPELSNAQDEFIDIEDHSVASWVKLSGVPRNWLERNISRPKISRYRGAFEALIATRRHQNPVIISHMPSMSAAVGMMDRIGDRTKKHIAFSFNFTNLPDSGKKKYYQSALQTVDKFVVFSDYERLIYSSYFGIAVDRFLNVLWTQNVPPIKETLEPVFHEPYLCAIGGEGRDFRTLLAAAEKSQIPLVIIARPTSIGDLRVPPNVRILCNIPLDETWSIAKNSKGVVVPLKTPETCCGQITVVSACMLGLPLLTNRAHALAEYLVEGSATLTFNFGDSGHLAEKMMQLMVNQEYFMGRASGLTEYYSARYSRELWSSCISKCLDGFL